MKQTITSLIIMLAIAFAPQPVMAEAHKVAETSAHTVIPEVVEDSRVSNLRAFLELYDSPMKGDAAHFVAEADRLGLDWKLVAAIAGVESTFGKHIPQNSYNGWGWAIYTGQSDGRHFTDWKDGITVVSEGLKYGYIDKGASTLEQIGRRYAASPTWSTKVRFFLNKIENFTPRGIDHLAVTI